MTTYCRLDHAAGRRARLLGLRIGPVALSVALRTDSRYRRLLGASGEAWDALPHTVQSAIKRPGGHP